MKMTTSLFTEIIVGFIILGSIYKGYQRGFINTAIPFVSLFIAICATETLVRPIAAIIAPFLGNGIGELQSMVAAKPMNQIKMLVSMTTGNETTYHQVVHSFNHMFSYWMTYALAFAFIYTVSSYALNKVNAAARSPIWMQVNRILGSAIEIAKSIVGIWICYALIFVLNNSGFVLVSGFLKILNQSLILSYVNEYNPLLRI